MMAFIELIDFSSMLTRQELDHTKKLGNRIHCKFVSIFFFFLCVVVSKEHFIHLFIFHTFMWNQVILTNRSISPSGLGSNCNEEVFHTLCNILTPDPAELSSDKCTCVNNRCIRSKISGNNLDCRRVELSANLTLTRSRWMSNNYITRCDRKFRSVGDQSLKSVFQFEEWEPDPAEAGPQVPRLSSPGERERNAAIARRVGVNMLQSLFNLQLTSHTKTLS